MKYDIFISYRREDGKEFARQIQLKLQNFGYNVFLDVEELRDGIFDKRIMDAICESTIFIALLTPKYFLRCNDTADWVRKEIECAIENKLNIVPVNINCQFKDFPADCPESLRSYIGAHQYSEVFTGQQFSNTMKDMDEHRIRPNINKDAVSSNLQPIGATIRIKPDIDCNVVKFGEKIATLKADTYNVLRLMKGKHLLDFVSIECSEDHFEKVYLVEDNNSEDFFEIELLPIQKKRLDLIEEEKRHIKEEEPRLKRETESEQCGIEEEVSRIERLVLEGKGRDGVYIPGDYFNRYGIQGVVVEINENDNYVKLVSLTEYRTQWASNKNFGNVLKKDIPSKTLLNADYSYSSQGYKNCKIIESITNWQDKYPAFYLSKNGMQAIIDDQLNMWHLPSLGDLECIGWCLDLINKTIKRLSSPILKEGSKYWTSTEKSAQEAYTCKFDRDSYSVDNCLSKSDLAYVRPIIMLPLYDQFKNLQNQDYKEVVLEKRWRDLGLIPCADGVYLP